jgi:hypothetical protein
LIVESRQQALQIIYAILRKKQHRQSNHANLAQSRSLNRLTSVNNLNALV